MSTHEDKRDDYSQLNTASQHHRTVLRTLADPLSAQPFATRVRVNNTGGGKAKAFGAETG